MRDDIDTNLVFRSKQTKHIYNILRRYIQNESNASYEDSELSNLEDMWEDIVEDLVSTVRLDACWYRNSVLEALSEHMDQAIRSSTERYANLYCNGIDEYHNERLVSLAKSVFPNMDTHASLLERISDIVECVTYIQKFRTYEFDLYVDIFGSSLSQLCTISSDIDLVIQGSFALRGTDYSSDSDSEYSSDNGENWRSIDSISHQNAIHVLKALYGHLCNKGRFSVTLIPAAQPLLQIYDPMTNLNCDLCFPVGGGIDPRKDQVLLALNMIDERFRLLFTLVKLWADEHSLCGASQGRLNSYTLVQLVIFHLQNRPDPILPKLKTILPGEKFGVFETGCRFTHGKEDIAVSAAHRLRCFANKRLLSFDTDHYGNRINACYKNSESMADLFNSFMVLMVGLFEGWNPDDIGTARCGFSSIPTSNLMRHLRISTYYGCLYFGESPVDEIERGIQNPKHYNDSGVIFVEDPFDKSQNTARALSRKCSRSIINAARRALNSFQNEYLDTYISQVFGCSN